MARTAFATHLTYLGRPGDPVAWTDRYVLSDGGSGGIAVPDGFADYGDRIRDLLPHAQSIVPERTQFPVAAVRRYRTLMFNIAEYGRTLTSDFLAAGGRIERAEFHAPAELAQLAETVVINCPGYGARALWQDPSIVPVRGQIGWLAPQPEVTYGLFYRGVSMVARRDGIVVQAVDGGNLRGYDDANETPDRGETEQAVATLAELYARFRVRTA